MRVCAKMSVCKDCIFECQFDTVSGCAPRSTSISNWFEEAVLLVKCVVRSVPFAHP